MVTSKQPPTLYTCHLEFPRARVADVERLDAVDGDPVAVVALGRALHVGPRDGREAHVRLPEVGVAGALGHARLWKDVGWITRIMVMVGHRYWIVGRTFGCVCL